MPAIGLLNCRSRRPHRGCQAAGLVAAPETGLTRANMLRAFQVGNALISDGGPSSWERPLPGGWGPGDLAGVPLVEGFRFGPVVEFLFEAGFVLPDLGVSGLEEKPIGLRGRPAGKFETVDAGSFCSRSRRSA